MNRSRRESLGRAIRFLEEAEGIVSSVRDEEQEAMECVPENLQSSQAFERMETAVDAMEDAMDAIGEARDALQNAQDA